MGKAEVHQIGREETWCKDGFQSFSIKRTNSEGNGGTDVSKYCVTHFFFHLFDVLVCNDEIQVVLSCFGQNIRKRSIRKRLKLIHIEIKVRHCFHLCNRQICPAHGGEINTGSEHGPEQVGICLANQTFREVHDHNFFIIHHLAEIKTGMWLSNDISNQWVPRKLTNFVLNGRQGLGRKAFGIVCILINPKGLYRWISTVVDNFETVCLVIK